MRRRSKAKQDSQSFNRVFYIGVLLLSVVFLFVGNRIATSGVLPPSGIGTRVYSVVVTEMIDRVESELDMWGADRSITFRARITSGTLRNVEVTAEQNLFAGQLYQEREVEIGDRVLLLYNEFSGLYFFRAYTRINYIILLGLAFLVLVVMFGKKKGLNSVIALGFTCVAIFSIFVPAILSGRNIYATTIIVCVFAIVSTLLTVIGPHKKAVASMLGCLGGVLSAGILMLFMNRVLNLTGFVDHESQYLLMLRTETLIDLNAIIFAGVTLGAVGAIMDVSMSIASSLWEVRLVGGTSHFGRLFTAGINIGKDILGTMLNTLILAYIGSSLSVILLLVAHTTSYVELFNREMVIVELLRALVGSFGMFLAIPLTSGICGWLYAKHLSPDYS